MIKIYEKGDIVELDDNVLVPYDLAASTISLDTKLNNGDWKISIIESHSLNDFPLSIIINEKWFL